jgi:hypothetical protein
MVFTVFAAARAVVARAQTDEATSPQPATTTPQAKFQYSALTGSVDAMLATRVPVLDSAGNVHYWDVTVLFDVDSKGNLTLASTYPHFVKSLPLLVSTFKAGNYEGPSTILGGKALITVSGPGVAPGGATEWSLAASTGANPCTYPSSATWYVGPLSSNPWAARITKAGISTSDYQDYSWGVGGSQDNCTTTYYDWEPNTLMAFGQINGTLTILSFTASGSDYSTSRDQITYRPIP